MNKIFILAIIASLNAPLKGDVINIQAISVRGSETVEVTEMGDDSDKISFSKDIESPVLNVQLLDFTFRSFETINGINACETDTSDNSGTLSMILLQSLNLDGCPISAGDYTVGEAFNLTGKLDDVFDYVKELITLDIKVLDGEDQSVFIRYNARLVEEDSDK